MSFVIDNSGFKGWKGGSETRKGRPDTVFVHKNTNGWNLIISINEERRLSMKATRNIGRIGKGMNDGQDASITIQLQTTNDRVPNFVKTDPHYNVHTASSTQKGWLEIDDKQNRVTESFKPELEFYQRKFAASSILEVNEFLLSLVPNFESLLKDESLDGYIGSIINEAADVQPKHKKQYIKPKHQVSYSKPTETDNEKLKATVDALTGVNESLRQRVNELQSKAEPEPETKEFYQ